MVKSAVLLLGGCLLTAGCAKDPTKAAPIEEPKKVVTGHGVSPVTEAPKKNTLQGSIIALKDNTLADYTQTSIGNAFDGYQHFDIKEWRETRVAGGKVYIDFIGLKKLGFLSRADARDVVARGVDVKFAIYLNGTFFVSMISKADLKQNGEIYLTPLEDKKQILDALYTNREMTF